MYTTSQLRNTLASCCCLFACPKAPLEAELSSRPVAAVHLITSHRFIYISLSLRYEV